MSKLRGAKKAAFLRRMKLGRTRARRKKGGVFGRAVRRRRRRTIRRNPLTTLIANPGYTRAYADRFESVFGGGAKPRRRKKRKGTKTMAKKRRKKGRKATRRAGRRKSVRRTSRRARRSGKRRAITQLRRGAYYVNPGRRKRRRSHRRRNPGGLMKRVFVLYAAGFVGGGLAGIIDTVASKKPVIGNLAKVAAAFAIAAFGRKHPNASAAMVGALAGSQGFALTTRFAGGIVAHSPAGAVKGLAEMSDEYPEMGALLNEGLGALLDGPDDLPANVQNYETALDNMADDDSDY